MTKREMAENLTNGVIARLLEPGSKVDRAWARLSQKDRDAVIEEAREFVEEALHTYARNLTYGGE